MSLTATLTDAALLAAVPALEQYRPPAWADFAPARAEAFQRLREQVFRAGADPDLLIVDPLSAPWLERVHLYLTAAFVYEAATGGEKSEANKESNRYYKAAESLLEGVRFGRDANGNGFVDRGEGLTLSQELRR